MAGAKLKADVHDYESARLFLGNKAERTIANNTVVQRENDGSICVVLHKTCIVRYMPDGHIRLDSGGWLTTTTKARMNSLLPPWYVVYQDKKEWYVHGPEGQVEFIDGIELRPHEEGATIDWKKNPSISADFTGDEPRFAFDPKEDPDDDDVVIPHIDDVEVDVWEERDRLSIVIRDKETGNTVAEWWDDDARSMFEDGFFESGRKLEESVLAYALEMDLVHDSEEEEGVAEIPDWLVTQMEQQAEAERGAGGSIEINESLPYVAVTLSDGAEYFFQGEEADELLASVPPNINEDDFILAQAQSW